MSDFEMMMALTAALAVICVVLIAAYRLGYTAGVHRAQESLEEAKQAALRVRVHARREDEDCTGA